MSAAPAPTPVTAPAAPGSPRRTVLVEQLVAAAALLAVGAGLELGASVTTGTAAVAALLPVWCSALHRHRWAGAVAALVLLAVASGVLLSALPGNRHDVEVGYAWATAVRTLTVVLGAVLVLWARRVLQLDTVVLLWGAGALVSGVLQSGGSSNPWKYQLALPVSLVLLAGLHRLRHRVPVVLTVPPALVLLAVLHVVDDYRSFLGFTVLTGLLLAGQDLLARRGGARTGLAARAAAAAALLLLGWLLYRAAAGLLLGGALGPELQSRTQDQVSSGGSLLVGGRPEWSATLVLVREHPAGLGLGAVPLPSDVLAAKAGLVRVGVAADNGYVDNYMFGGQFRLHSVLADAWAAFGWAGVALVAVVALVVADGLLTRLASHRASPAVVLLALLALWDVGFGPMYTNLGEVALAFAVVLPAAGRAGSPLSAGPTRPDRR